MIDLPPPLALPSHPPALPGEDRRFGDYELLEPLSNGRIFRLDRALNVHGQSVVLKRARGDSASTRARLQREAQIMSALCVRNMLRVEAYLSEPEPALALEYVHGATLRQLLASVQAEDLRFAVSALIGALHGLAPLHAAGLVHQAPVARHVLVGIDGVARLIDLSHLRGESLGSCEGAEQGLVMSELAPEQLQGEALDPRCDVFIAGRALRELLAGCRDAKCAPLDEVWQRATSIRREDRYLDADELAYATVRAARSAELTATPEELATWVRGRMSEPRPWRTSEVPEEPAVQARSSVPVSGSWHTVLPQPDDTVQTDAPVPSVRPRKRFMRELSAGVVVGGLALGGLIAMRPATTPEQAAAPLGVKASALAAVAAPARASAPDSLPPQHYVRAAAQAEPALVAPQQSAPAPQAVAAPQAEPVAQQAELARVAPQPEASVAPERSEPAVPRTVLSPQDELRKRSDHPAPKNARFIEGQLIRRVGSVPDNPYQ